MLPYGYQKLMRLCNLRNHYAPAWVPETDELCTLHNYYAPVWLPEAEEIMQPAQSLCTRLGTGN